MKTYILLAFMIIILLGCRAPEATAPRATQPPTVSEALETILPKDAIQTLDHPRTVPANEAELDPYEMVIGITLNGVSRAYPIGLMSRYEIANDTLGGQPIAVIFCPLCNSGLVLEREITDEAYEKIELKFGVSGKLLDGALVMYDQQTSSLWAQSRLEAIAGQQTGQRLELLPANQMIWQEWLAAHPKTTLVVDEQAAKAHKNFELRILPEPETEANFLAAPEGYVIGVASEQEAVAFPLKQIEASGVINAEVAGLPPFVLVGLGEPGAVAAWQLPLGGQRLTFEQEENVLRDLETGSQWDGRTGKAYAGSLAGSQLDTFPVLLTHWLGWKDLYANTHIWQE